jgi:phenylacetate-CoA ligase
MGIALLKKLNTCMPDPLKQMAAPVIRAKLIYNTEFQKQFNTLEKAQYSSAADIEKMQFEKLKAVLIHAYEHVPYYHKIFDKCGLNVYNIKDSSEISKIPTLDKAEIIANFDELQADDIDDFYSATTGGSTGTPLKVNLDRDSIYKERAFIYHFWEQHGYSYKSSKMASFRGTDFHGGFIKYNPLYNEIQLNPCEINTETISEYIKRMESFGVDFLHGFPSAIYSLCKCAKQLNIDLKNKYKAVFLISENIYDFQRKMIKEVLECDTFAFFGHTERAVFAEQIGGGGGYRFNPLYGYVQIDTDGSIICTGFINQKMPLIRYRLDDTATPYYDLFKIEGHRDGVLYGNDGEIISAAMLEVHSPILDKIANYQFVQEYKGFLFAVVLTAYQVHPLFLRNTKHNTSCYTEWQFP